MSSVIYKYTIKLKNKQTVELPLGAKVLKFGHKGDDISLWAMVDSEESDKLPLDVIVIGTGNAIEESLDRYEHVETIITGFYVWHIYANRKQLERFKND